MESERRRPRKVLHVLNSAAGGAALSTIGLMNAFWDQGIAACAVCHDAGSAVEREQLQSAVRGQAIFMPLYWSNKKIRSPLWKRPLLEARALLKTGCARRSAARVAEFASQQRVDLIHTNTLLTPEGGIAARKLGLPHVWHLRELVGPGNPYRFCREGPALGAHLARNCSKLIANSEVTAEQIRAWLPPGLLEIVPNGIDVARFTPRESVRPSGPIRIAMVGNLSTHWKKHKLFAEAASLVDHSLPIEWRIYGHDPSEGGRVEGDAYVDELHATLARAGLSDRFRWPGFVADPVAIMSEIDILVHPADKESFGRVVVEAMAAGLPVVGVRAGGVRGIVEDGVTGLLAAPDDARQMADCVERLARDSALCHSMGLAGRRRAEAHFSIEACAAGVLRVYEQAMARPLGPRRPASAVPAGAASRTAI